MSDQVSQGLLSPLLQRFRISAARPFVRGKLLDYGCGRGNACRLSVPAQYFGYDQDQDSIRHARESFPGYHFENQLPDLDCYDTILLLAVVEHIADPGALLYRLSLMLSTDGRLILTTPHPKFEILHTVGASIGLFSNDAADEHEQLYDFSGLCRIANQASLEIVEYRPFLYGANQLAVMKKKHQG